MPRGKKNIVNGRSYMTQTFFKKKLTRQKYYKPTNTLTKTQLKERREAVKEKVHDSVDQSRETVMTLLS